MIKDFVSVIIPVYNDIRFLKESIESIYNQSVPDFEIILIDDGSTNSDQIKVLSAGYSQKLTYIRNSKNIGLAASRNVGIRNSVGEYLCFLDADDYFAPDKLKVQMAILRASPGLSMVFSDEYLVRDGKVFGKTDLVTTYNLPIDSPGILDIFAEKSFIAVFTVLIRRSVIEKIGYFEERLRAWEDVDFWFRIMLYGEVKFSDYTSGYRRLHNANMSADRHVMNYYAIVTFSRWVKFCNEVNNASLKSKIKRIGLSFFKIYLVRGIKTLDFNVGVLPFALRTWLA